MKLQRPTIAATTRTPNFLPNARRTAIKPAFLATAKPVPPRIRADNPYSATLSVDSLKSVYLFPSLIFSRGNIFSSSICLFAYFEGLLQE